MENYAKAAEYSATATDSAGTALDKYENSYLNSVAAAQDRLTASFEKFSTTVLNSGLVSGVLNAGAGVLGVLSQITDTLGIIPTLAIAAGAALSFKNAGGLKMMSPMNTPAVA